MRVIIYTSVKKIVQWDSVLDVPNGRSEARNRVVANVFKELGLIEQWGSGLNRIVNACKKHGLQTPKIAEKNDFFDVEIIRPQLIEQIKATEKPSESRKIADDYGRLRTISERKTRHSALLVG